MGLQAFRGHESQGSHYHMSLSVRAVLRANVSSLGSESPEEPIDAIETRSDPQGPHHRMVGAMTGCYLALALTIYDLQSVNKRFTSSPRIGPKCPFLIVKGTNKVGAILQVLGRLPRKWVTLPGHKVSELSTKPPTV